MKTFKQLYSSVNFVHGHCSSVFAVYFEQLYPTASEDSRNYPVKKYISKVIKTPDQHSYLLTVKICLEDGRSKYIPQKMALTVFKSFFYIYIFKRNINHYFILLFLNLPASKRSQFVLIISPISTSLFL